MINHYINALLFVVALIVGGLAIRASLVCATLERALKQTSQREALQHREWIKMDVPRFTPYVLFVGKSDPCTYEWQINDEADVLVQYRGTSVDARDTNGYLTLRLLTNDTTRCLGLTHERNRNFRVEWKQISEHQPCLELGDNYDIILEHWDKLEVSIAGHGQPMRIEQEPQALLEIRIPDEVQQKLKSPMPSELIRVDIVELKR